jgi:hypothetical protein
VRACDWARADIISDAICQQRNCVENSAGWAANQGPRLRGQGPSALAVNGSVSQRLGASAGHGETGAVHQDLQDWHEIGSARRGSQPAGGHRLRRREGLLPRCHVSCRWRCNCSRTGRPRRQAGGSTAGHLGIGGQRRWRAEGHGDSTRTKPKPLALTATMPVQAGGERSHAGFRQTGSKASAGGMTVTEGATGRKIAAAMFVFVIASDSAKASETLSKAYSLRDASSGG